MLQDIIFSHIVMDDVCSCDIFNINLLMNSYKHYDLVTNCDDSMHLILKSSTDKI